MRENKRWRAEIGEGYYRVDFNRQILCTVDTDEAYDRRKYSDGNYFKTKEEAIEVLRKMYAVLKEHQKAKEQSNANN